MFIRLGTPSGFKMMSTAVPSARNGMSSIGQDLGDDALVAVAAGELVALVDLALLRDVDAHELVHARRQVVAGLAAEGADRDDATGLAVRDLQRGVAHLARLLTEDRAQEALLGGELGLALGGDLAHEHVAGEDLGADADDAVFVEVARARLRRRWGSRG